jgi:hypothetical protein
VLPEVGAEESSSDGEDDEDDDEGSDEDESDTDDGDDGEGEEEEDAEGEDEFEQPPTPVEPEPKKQTRKERKKAQALEPLAEVSSILTNSSISSRLTIKQATSSKDDPQSLSAAQQDGEAPDPVEAAKTEDPQSTPLPGETLAVFYSRTRTSIRFSYI